MVVDFRIHPPFKTLNDIHFFRPRPEVDDPVSGSPFVHGRETPPSFHDRSMETFLAEMDEAGVDHGVIMGQQVDARWGSSSNDDVAELVRSVPERFSGFAGLQPHSRDLLGEAKRAVRELGLVGIALTPGWADPPVRDDHRTLIPLYRWCSDNGVPVMITSSHFIGPDMLHAHPVHLQRVALQFPELTLIVGHASWPWTTAACSLAMRCANVYLMPEFYMYLPNMPGSRDYVDAANGFLQYRMLYSSCYPSNSLSKALEHFRALGLTESAQEHLLSINASRLLGLS